MLNGIRTLRNRDEDKSQRFQ